MGLFARLGRTPAPTATDLVENENRASPEEDIEKAGTGIELETRHQPHHHDTTAERAVRSIILPIN